jgi:DNA-binding transcriptional LysR family regulator
MRRLVGAGCPDMIVAVQAYPTRVPNSGKIQRTPARVTPTVRARIRNVSIALAIVGELMRRSAAISSSFKIESFSSLGMAVFMGTEVEYSDTARSTQLNFFDPAFTACERHAGSPTLVSMELREVRSLLALSEAGSIRQAAATCNISPAAMHKHLKTLESEFGVRLYEKHDGRLRLTEAGRILVPIAREMLLNYDAAFAAMEEWKGGGRGVVRVGAGPSFSSNLLPALIKRFRRKFPRVDVYVETGDSDHLISRLSNGALDLIFDLAGAAAGHKNLEQVVEWEATAAFISARADVPSHCSLRTLEKTPFILFRKGTLIETVIEQYFSGLQFRPNVVMRSDSSEAIKAMVHAGLGVSVLLLWNLDGDSRSPALSVLRTDAPPLSVRMALIRVQSSYTPKAAREFILLASSANWKHLHLVRDRR